MRPGLFAMLMLLVSSLSAQQGLSPEQEVRFHKLVAELRCLVCQNQNIADSNAPLAEDLRAQVHRMIEQGHSDAQIKDYLVARYGDFVLYNPPLKPQTWLLWGGPFLLLLLGLIVAARILLAGRNRAAAPEELAPDADALKKALREDKPS